ncbi:MAG: biotin-dependent carboxyltransferase family protein [Eubacteriales bacterium]|nr:biotin-dependent carboxyltransferase family protein [Eubacteriales bacterium]
MALEILAAGPLATVQDMGREGMGSLGYRRCGAADKYAMRLANILAGNMKAGTDVPERAAAIEFTLSGGRIRFTKAGRIALAGADMSPKLDGEDIPMYASVQVRAGQILELGFAARGLRMYLAVGGGINTKPVLGSRSTDCACALGGADGRALRAGDILETGKFTEQVGAFALGEDYFWLKRPSHPYRSVGEQLLPVLRVVAGPQEEAFTEEAKENLRRGVYQVTSDSNRMACRLKGPALAAKGGSDILSDGIVEGSIQVAANGLPMVMLADHQTTGGYAKIGTVISTDIPAIAQRKPGECIGFTYITPKEAGEAYRKEVRKLEWLKQEMITH